MNYYKTDSKGKQRVSMVTVEDDTLSTWTGIVGGELKSSSKVYTGNSRFNGIQQAQTAYNLKCKNLEKKGYSIDSDAKPKFIAKPMLVGRWDKLKVKPEYPLIVQPKLDGLRALLKDGKFTTRSMEPLDVPHITYNSDEYLDGELYCPDMKLQDITIEDIRIHGEGQRQFIRLRPVVNQYMRKQVPGFVSNILFRNITVDGKPGDYLVPQEAYPEWLNSV